MSGDDQAPLPPALQAAVDAVLMEARLHPGAAREVRDDLEQHFRDGLAAGRSPEELLARFGTPCSVASALSAGPGPRRPLRTSGAGRAFLASWGADLRYAFRLLLRNPTLAATAAVVLALGIGANTVVFTVVSELLLRPLPVREPATLVDVWPNIPGGNSFLGFSYQDFLAYRNESGALSDLAAFSGLRLTVGQGSGGEDVVGQLVSQTRTTDLTLIRPGRQEGQS